MVVAGKVVKRCCLEAGEPAARASSRPRRTTSSGAKETAAQAEDNLSGLNAVVITAPAWVPLWVMHLVATQWREFIEMFESVIEFVKEIWYGPRMEAGC